MFEEDDNEPDPHCKELAQLPPYTQRTWQPVEPDPVRHRRQPLRHPQYRIPLVPLIAGNRHDASRRRLRAPFLIPGVGSYLPT
nr:hypothetical protein [Rhizobium phaseoli]